MTPAPVVPILGLELTPSPSPSPFNAAPVTLGPVLVGVVSMVGEVVVALVAVTLGPVLVGVVSMVGEVVVALVVVLSSFVAPGSDGSCGDGCCCGGDGERLL